MADYQTNPNFVVAGRRLNFTYTNWQGETATRHVRAQKIRFSATKSHPEPQWIMTAIDMGDNQMRQFAMRDMKDVTYAD